MKLEKYDRFLILMVIISTVVNFLAHLYDYTFYNGGFIVNTFSSAFDVPQHLVYTMEILRGTWPFQNPMATGFSINYPIGLPLLAAVFIKITGAPVIQMFRFFSIVLNIFVGLTSYIMISSLLRSKRIGFYATFFLLFSGGFLWATEFFPIFKEFWTLYKYLRVEDEFYAYLVSVNLLRPLSRTFGFGLFCFYFYFLNSFLKSNKNKFIVLNGILLVILINTSPGMVIELFILSIMALLYFKIPLNNIMKYFLILISISFISIPSFFTLLTGIITGISEEGSLLSVLSLYGWRYLSPIYYPSLFGTAFVLMVIGIFFYPMKEKKFRKFLLIWLAIALFFANLSLIGITFQTLIFNLLFNIPLHIFSSLGLVKLLDYRPNFTKRYTLKRYVVLILAVSCCFSTLRLVYFRGYVKTVNVDEQEYNALIWMRNNTEKDAVFLTYHYVNIEKTIADEKFARSGQGQSWVVLIGERRVVLNLRGVFLTRGIDLNEVVRIARDIDLIYMANDVKMTVQLLKSYSVNYIYIGPDEQERYEVAVNKFQNQKYFENVYLNNSVTIYKLKTT